jgi:hypothetical protein
MTRHRPERLVAPAVGGKVHGRRGLLGATSYTTCGLRIRNGRAIELGAEPVTCRACSEMMGLR